MAKAATGPRLIKEAWWAVRTVKGTKYSKCLGTDEREARRLWPDAYAQLGPPPSRLYRPDELITITRPDGSLETMQAMELLNVKELTYDPWQQLEQPSNQAWEDAFEVTRRRHQRRSRKPLSGAWESQVKALRRYIPQGVLPADLTPQHVRHMMERMERDGHSDSTISTRIATLGGIFTALIRSGTNTEIDNPVTKVDSSAPSLTHHKTATEEDYRYMFSSRMAQDVVLLRMIYLGVRIGEAFNGQVVGDTFVIKPTDTWSPKNRASVRTLPLPEFLQEDVKLPNMETWRAKFSRVREKDSGLVNHSWRHGMVQLARQTGADPLTLEAVLGHKLPAAVAMLNVYGNGYQPDTMRQQLLPIWAVLDGWREEAS